ncbi:MAG: MFS transporter [Candidatus Nanohaloarchaea archaeon]
MALQEIPRITKYLSAVMLFAWLGRNMVWQFLPVYFKMHIDMVFLIGLLTSLPSAVAVLLDIPVSNYVQRVGEKFVFFTGLLVGALPALAYLIATPLFLTAGKVFEGVTKSLIWNSGWSLSMKSSEESTESKSLSVFLLGANLAAIIGPIVGGYLILNQGFSLVLGLWMLTAIISLGIFISYIGVSSKGSRVLNFEKLFKSKTYSNDVHHLKENWSRVRPAYIMVFLYSIIFSFFWLAVPLALEEAGASYVEMGIIFGLAALPKAFQILFGDFADRIGKKKGLIVFSMGLAPVLFGMYFLESTLMLGAFFFVAAALTNGLSPVIHAIFDSRAPEEVESELVGFMETFKHIGSLVGPTMAGAVASAFSLSASFASAGVIALVMLAYSVKLYRF